MASTAPFMFRTEDGDRLFVIESQRREVAANLVLIHGLGDHAARNFGIARRLASEGFRIFLFDLAGHGAAPHDWKAVRWIYDAHAARSSRRDLVDEFRRFTSGQPAAAQALARAQYNRLATTHVQDHVRQVERVVAHVRTHGGRAPLFLLGHSMGGLLATDVSWRLHQAGAGPEGLVLIAPAFGPTGNPECLPMQIAVAGTWAGRRGPASPLRFVVKRLLDLNLPVDMTWGGKWLSDIPEEVALFESDPLVPHRLPTRYASSVESLMAEVGQRGHAFPIPGLVIVPGRDGITDRGSAVDFARSVNAATGVSRLTLIGFDVVAHDILRSTAGGPAMDDVLTWLGSRVPRAAVPYDIGRMSRAS